MHDTVFSLKEVSFRFPEEDKLTLQGLTFEINRGERVVISGPSGSGKSTLLYLLNRLYPYNCDGILKGEIRLFGKPAETYAPGEINGRIATVFQDPDSQFCMPTVEEELAFTLENLHVAYEEMEERITEALELTGLTAFRHSVIQSLSGGMKQRIATACALVMRPDVLLLDEPISHLDPYTAKEFIHWLDRLQRLHHWTIVAVEHRLDLWEDFFNREIRISTAGTLQADCPFAHTFGLSLPQRSASFTDCRALTAAGLSVQVKGETLLHADSLALKQGEVMVVAGPNGSGKSTLLKSLCGVYPLAAGTVDSLPIGYVPQSPEYLFVTSSVEAELEFSGASSRDEVAEIRKRLRLEEIAKAHPFSVSHGQKRRIAIGAMLADRRQVLLMDEPTAGQDAAALQELAELIDQRTKEGVSFLIVTHDMEFAEAVADSVLLIKDGKTTGKFRAADVWSNEPLLTEHHLLPPKGGAVFAGHFA